MIKNKFFSLITTLTLTSTLLVSCGDNKESKENQGSKPNILIIVGDDLGFTDIAPFGGNIETPTLSKLSKESVSFSKFYVQPTCSPTRSSLLTGNDNHVAGFGVMSEVNYPALQKLNLPGYSGELSNEVVTIPEILKENGYHTYMTGKWHLGDTEANNPYNRGFEETFILGTGGGSHYNDKKPLSPLQKVEYTRNGKPVDPPADFYSSKTYTDLMIEFIDKNKADKKPFFGYLSYTAVHDPLHAPEEYIKKYKGKFDMGWDELWKLRLNNLKALGIVPKDLKNFSENPAVPKWETLSKEEKAEAARDMEVYAAMLDYMDMSIGRVIDYLKKEGMYDNTMIVFMSDNGANGASATTYPGNGDGKYLSSFDNSLENRGLKNSYVDTGAGWARASSSPFRFFKSFTTEGGIKAPLLVKMPGKMKNAGQWNKNFVHVTDIMPTILELTGASYPKNYKGNTIHPLIGKSILPVLKGEVATVHDNDGQGWELFEMKAYVQGNWKVLRLPKPLGTGNWELYDVDIDPSETNDLSNKHPEIKKQLIEKWEKYAKENNVFDHKGHFDTLYQKSFVHRD